MTPIQIANYRKSITLRNKTDCDDARLIAQFAATVSTTEWQLIPPNIQCLRDLLKRRRMLKQMYIAMRNSADTLQDRTQCRSACSDLNYIRRRIKQIDASIAKVIGSDKQLAKRRKLLFSIPGIGELTAAIIIAALTSMISKMRDNSVLLYVSHPCAINPLAVNLKVAFLKSAMHTQQRFTI